MNPRTASNFVALLALACLSPNVHAANGTWTYNNNGNWHDTARWSGGTVANGVGDTADFTTLNIAGTRIVTLDGLQTGTWGVGNTGPMIGTIKLGDTTPSNHGWTFNSLNGGTLTLAVGAGSPLITVGNLGTGVATLSALILGTQGLTKSGVGALILGNTANAFSGDIRVTGGELRVNGDNRLGADANDIFLTDGGVLSFTAGFTLDADRTIDVGSGGGTLAITGTIMLSATGQLTGSDTLTKLGTGILDLRAANTGFTGAINVAAGALRLMHNDALAGFGTVTVGTAGTLTLAYSRTLDPAASTPVFQTGSKLRAEGATATLAGSYGAVMGGLGVSGAGTITGAAITLGDGATINASGPDNTITNDLSLSKATAGNGTLSVDVSNNSGFLTLSGNLTPTGSAFDLVKTGGYALALSGANSLASITLGADRGTLRAESTQALGGAQVSIGNNSGLWFGVAGIPSAQLAKVSMLENSLLTVAANYSFDGASEIDFEDGARLTVSGGSTVTLTQGWTAALANVTVGGGGLLDGDGPLRVGDGAALVGSGSSNTIATPIALVKSSPGNGKVTAEGTGNSARLILNGSLAPTDQPFDLEIRGINRWTELNGNNTLASVFVGSRAFCAVNHSGGLGTGDVTVTTLAAAGGVSTLTLNAAAVGDAATLALNSATDVVTYYPKVIVNVAEDVVGVLVLDGAPQAPGTYGSTASPAQFTDDNWFGGTGVLRVAGPAAPKGTVVTVR